jgi:D-serine deaminase-like pyridoxal phosphate-dependent protein
MTGRVGAGLDLEGGKAAARQVGLAILATLRDQLGSLDPIKRVVKVLGMVNCTPDFADHPKVINGCSELFADVFGPENGIGARSAVGMGSLPGNIAVEIDANWFQIENVDEVASPALLFYPERISANIERVIEIAGGTERLRPHIKTHKAGMIVIMHLAQGITKFKCATIAEAELLATHAAPDVLLAHQPVGPNVARVIELIGRFPETKFSVIADDEGAIKQLADAAKAADIRLSVLLDVDCGMHRTGVAPGPRAIELYRLIATSPGLTAAGLHAYDGHIHETDLQTRQARCGEAFVPVNALRGQIVAAGLPFSLMVAGGTPTFPIHAQPPHAECSPGTYVLWDFGYADMLPGLPFEIAALVFTRVVSKPAANRLCLDLGHKAVAAENPQPRVRFLNLPDARAVMHSEEHLVVETELADRFAVGDCLYGVPKHICPTVALYNEAVVVDQGRAVDRWPITARARRLEI